eukprot:GHVT01030336.1.p1 GENE.GHVT01030336.1~~GHVT01030336.1.p1  ORF type:complete len:351 (-),score=50.64 GHVT01030336.1:1887-2939(-)
MSVSGVPTNYLSEEVVDGSSSSLGQSSTSGSNSSSSLSGAFSSSASASSSSGLHHPPGTKTELCKYFARGYCRNAESCIFAHGEVELAARGNSSMIGPSPSPEEQIYQQGVPTGKKLTMCRFFLRVRLTLTPHLVACLASATHFDFARPFSWPTTKQLAAWSLDFDAPASRLRRSLEKSGGWPHARRPGRLWGFQWRGARPHSVLVQIPAGREGPHADKPAPRPDAVPRPCRPPPGTFCHSAGRGGAGAPPAPKRSPGLSADAPGLRGDAGLSAGRAWAVLRGAQKCLRTAHGRPKPTRALEPPPSPPILTRHFARQTSQKAQLSSQFRPMMNLSVRRQNAPGFVGRTFF